MPFNGSGTFVSLPAPDFPALPGTTILASSFNANMNDVFTNGLTKCMTRDGQSPPTANIPMGGFKLTGVGNGTVDTDAAALGQSLALRGQVGVVDWDTRTTIGIFEATSVSLTTPSANFPPTSDLGQLLVIPQGALINQYYQTANTFYSRQKIAGVWSKWTFGVANPNFFINGPCWVWQAGTSLPSGTGNRYLMDMCFELSAGTTYTPSQQSWPIGQTDVDPMARFFKRVVVASVAGATNFCNSQYKIEDARTLSGRTVTVSLWAKANTTLSISFELVQSFGSGGSPSANVTTAVSKQTITTTWARYTGTATLPSVSGKTFGSNDDSSLGLLVWMDAGSSFNARTFSLGQQSGTFDFFGIKVEEGSSMSAFTFPSQTTMLNDCFRYYVNMDNWPPKGRVNFQGNTTSGSAYNVAVNFPVVMRAVPFTVTYQEAASSGFPATAATVDNIAATGARFTKTATGTGASTFIGSYTADARL